MHTNEITESRIQSLERRLRRTQFLFVICIVAGLGAAGLGLAADDNDRRLFEELRARRIVVVDDQDVPRVVIGQDPKDTERRSRAAGITIHDRKGHERGGMSTFDDDSVVLALDAPHGVGSQMPDRLALSVYPNGAAHIAVIGNDTGMPVRLATSEDGAGGLEFISYDLPNRKAFVKRINYAGESTTEFSLDQ